jgi:DNA-binding transcriptional regulator GbsR (MarR family)
MGCSSEFLATKKEFIENWGRISGFWGICKSMAQVHALLIISSKPLSAPCIIEELEISSGGVNTHLRELVEWGLVYKCQNTSGRKDYYFAEKNMLTVFRQIILNRKRRELDPIIDLIQKVDHQQANCAESTEFVKVITDIKVISSLIDNALDSILNIDQENMMETLIKMEH